MNMAKTETLARTSPLAHRDPLSAEGLTMSELPYLGKLILRSDSKTASAKVKKALGAALPEAGQSSASNQANILWLAPDEWLIITNGEDVAPARAKLESTLSGSHYQIADVTDYYTVISIAGEKAREVLATCCTLDLHPSQFAAGAVAGTTMVHAVAILHLSTEEANGPTFHVFVRWSFADYLWCTLAEGGRSLGLPRQHPVDGERIVIPE